ncbi:MAG: adenosyl-hopene transferase HpnH [Deltaproteobacteria bacterium]|nr:adenosyl-hopene transferase HpnH [Deltaproteobacteria bacterium]
MSVPAHQAFNIAVYLFKQKLLGRKKYPLNLMLEPLFRCNLACPGCGKIQYPEEKLKKHLSVEQALSAANECGAPMVTIPGGEPLIHPQIEEMVEGLLAQKRYVILCTNALLLERSLPKFKPNKRLTFSVHVDGYQEHHDHCVDREGTYEIATKAIKAALEQGFRVITNTTVFEGSTLENLAKLFDHMTELGVEGFSIAPGYSYEKALDQEHFLSKKRTHEFFGLLLTYKRNHKKKWPFNNSPFYLDFLEGKRDYECTPWGMPTYNVFGWQKPCYLLTKEGYAKTFKEYMEHTEFEKFGKASGNPKCAHCMTHCGYEPSAVADALSSVGKMIQMGKATAA